ncbi:hypothetical protein [Fodinicola acaciae]|uniref:hypothetical protein n=1 Tax=Fodinicola acaciae TaxID=2681555 RepID=UPI0013D5FF75|nr:hypothetical protein [Fodinicola acaciae]
MKATTKILRSIRGVVAQQVRMHDRMMAAHRPWADELHWVHGPAGWTLEGRHLPAA